MADLPITRQGEYVDRVNNDERYQSFIPGILPLTPPLELSNNLQDLLEKANRALGRLDGITTLLPDTSLFIYNYVRKEAVLSSQIEGTQSSLADLLMYESDEIPGVPLDDVREVSNYVRAMEHGLKRVREDNFPISSRLIKEVHKVLLSDGRGGAKLPGEFRRSPVWLGGVRPSKAIFVPPPFELVEDLMANLEGYIHDEVLRTPTLIKAGIAHAQFETIHPFLDGNGRLGRLLIALLLCSETVLAEPVLYLSLYFKTNRDEYYESLQRVRTQGDWEVWMEFFLQGVFETAQQAFTTAQSLLELIDRDQKKIRTIGRSTGSALQLLQLVQRKIFFNVKDAGDELRLSLPTVRGSVEALESLGILRETTGKGRGRVWVYDEYLKILDRGIQI